MWLFTTDLKLSFDQICNVEDETSMYKAVKPALCEGTGTGIMKSTVLVLGPVQALGSVQVLDIGTRTGIGKSTCVGTRTGIGK